MTSFWSHWVCWMICIFILIKGKTHETCRFSILKGRHFNCKHIGVWIRPVALKNNIIPTQISLSVFHCLTFLSFCLPVGNCQYNFLFVNVIYYLGGEFWHHDPGWGRSVRADQNQTREEVQVWDRCRSWGCPSWFYRKSICCIESLGTGPVSQGLLQQCYRSP